MTKWLSDEGNLHKYRTELPNLVDDMDLTPQAFRLYAHLKRVAGDSGECYQNTDTLAKKCKMSKTLVVRSKKELEKIGLISVKYKSGKGGGRYHNITIKDIWLKNMQQYHVVPTSVLPSTNVSTNMDLKKNPLKKNPKKNTRKRDPRLDHPAIIAYKSEAHLHVPISWRDEVCDTVSDVELWKKIIHEWIGRGWNRQNIKGLLEAYRAGGINNRKPPPKREQRDPKVIALMQQVAESTNGETILSYEEAKARLEEK